VHSQRQASGSETSVTGLNRNGHLRGVRVENPFSPTGSSELIELRDDFQWSPEQYLDIRREHFHYERTIKDFGALSMLFGFLTMLVCLVGFVCGVLILIGRLQWAGYLDKIPPRLEFSELMMQGAGWVVVSLLGGGLSYGFIRMGSMLRELDPRGRSMAFPILVILAVLVFPISTLVSIYLWGILWSEKGKGVFSLAYMDVVRATPSVRLSERATFQSILAWPFAFVFLGILAATCIGGLIGGLKPPV
jgi:hypothetical protein